MNNYIYLHENVELSNDNIEVKLDLAQDSSSSESNNLHNDNGQIELTAKNDVPIFSKTSVKTVTSSPLEDQITSRQPRHIAQSSNQHESGVKGSFHRPMVLSKPSKKVSRNIQSHKNIYSSDILESITNNDDGNSSKKAENWSLHTPTLGLNSTEATEEHENMMNLNTEDEQEDYEDLAIDLMARDVRHFDNYSNISSMSQR